jgi:hypothetical protein
MDQSSFVEQRQAIEQLLGKDADKSCAEAAELVLLDELVQVDAEQFEDETQMLAMNKGIFETEEMVVVVFVEFCVELVRVSTQDKPSKSQGGFGVGYVPDQAQKLPSYSG